MRKGLHYIFKYLRLLFNINPMDIFQKAVLRNKYLKLNTQVKHHLDSFEVFCKTKNKFPEGTPEKAVYEDSIMFLNSVPGKWVEFELLDKTYRIEANYGIDFEFTLIETYDVHPDSVDRSKLVYERLNQTIIIAYNTGALRATGQNEIMSIKNHLGEKATVPMSDKPLNDLGKDYIDFLWDTHIQKLFEKR